MKQIARLGGWASSVALLVAVGFGGAPVPVQAGPVNFAVTWNQQMLNAVVTANTPAPLANRLGAIVSASVFDAVNGIEQRYHQLHEQKVAPADASPKAAAVSAAHEALLLLFPPQHASLDAAFAASLQSLGDDGDVGIGQGIAWGKTVADDTVAWRSADGFTKPLPTYVFSSAVGQWQQTPGGSGPPKFRGLANVTPYALTSASEVRPAGPPALTSARYAQDFNEVKDFGGSSSTLRTPTQTQTAQFWQLELGLVAWDGVADDLLLQNHFNLLKTARLLAQTNIAISDAVVAVFDAKNTFNSWRPVTAIVNADLDGNPATTSDPTWLPLLTTPYFQEYPSAHSGTSSAAASILASVFGNDTTFTVTSTVLTGVTRTFASFADAVAQVEDARVFAGFHFRFSCDDADVMGAEVASAVLGRLMQPASDRGRRAGSRRVET